MLRTLLSSFVLSLAALVAQQDAQPATPDLPAVASDQARDMVDAAFAKMLAYGRGMFTSRQSNDLAFARQAGIPFGGGDVELHAGWHRDLVFGEWAGRKFVRGNGRIASSKDGDWHVAADRLVGGKKLPFTIDPQLLFTVLSKLPAGQRKVVHVEAGELRGRKVAILTLQLSGSDAHDFADHGVVPEGSGGFGDVIMIGGIGGDFEPPRADQTTYIACFVDLDNNDLLRLAVRTIGSGGAGGFQIAIGGVVGGPGDDDDDDEQAGGEESQPEQGANDGKPVGWKQGFPAGKPGDKESVMTFTIDFTKLGLADVPAIDDAVKPLVGAR